MIIWLASYPKSGRTWVSSFLSNYIFNDGNEFSFQDLNKIRSFPSNLEISFLKRKFGSFKFIDLVNYWNNFQSQIIKNNNYTFLKTHNALCTVNGKSFTSLKNSLGLIYIIRDPRDVAISYSSHLKIKLGETVNLMLNESGVEKTEDNIDKTLMTSWANHYNSWKYFPVEKIIIKYEDLIDSPDKVFSKIIIFLNKLIKVKFNKNLISKSINNVRFEKLKDLEDKVGFEKNRSEEFFRVGKKEQYKELLPKNLEQLLIEKFEKEMSENNYI